MKIVVLTLLVLLAPALTERVDACGRSQSSSNQAQHQQHQAQAPNEATKKTAAMGACEQMMAAQTQLAAELDAMDAKLTGLVATMNAAGGSEKIEAIAAAVTELAAQRTQLREKLGATAAPMGHMMDHTASGTSPDAKQPMAGCPMAQQTGAAKKSSRE